jgi:hypothetical protein
MIRPLKTYSPFVLCIFLTVLAYPQDEKSAKEEPTRGRLEGGNVYYNPALGMKISLPGTWELLPQRATKSHPHSDCRGPLCGDPDIDVGIATKAASSPAYRVFLAGYKLSPQYLDRNRNPLSRFAEIMMAGSLGGSDLVPMGTQTAIQLDGKQAFRLLAGKRGDNVARTFGYVSEDNTYLFLPSARPRRVREICNLRLKL